MQKPPPRQAIAKSELEREGAALTKAVAGQRTAERRRVIRKWLRDHRTWPFATIVRLAELFWLGDPRDEAIPIELLGLSRRHIASLSSSFFERWRKPLCTWHDTDGLGIYVFGPWLAADAARVRTLQKLIQARDRCSRRLALVGTVTLNRQGQTAIPQLTLKLVDAVAHERDPLITKAVSWALRELTKTHADVVKQYVEKNADRLPAIAVREVRMKLRTGLKNPKRRAAASD